MQSGDTIIFTGHGALKPGTDKVEDFLDVIASIRDEYLKKRQGALDQTEMFAGQGNMTEASISSSEAERHAASALSASRILKLAEAFFDGGP